MKNNENQSKTKRIYDRGTGKWYDVSEEQYADYNRWHSRIMMRRQREGLCICPKSRLWVCDGVCDGCEFAREEYPVSLDYAIEEDGELRFYLPGYGDPSQNVEETVLRKIEREEMLQKLKEIMPEAFVIGRLRLEGLTDREIADRLGIKRTTMIMRLKAAKKELRKYFPDFFCKF